MGCQRKNVKVSVLAAQIVEQTAACRRALANSGSRPCRHGPVACSPVTVVSVLVSIHPRPPPFTGVRVFVFAQATDGGERW